jgi:hypothetical protein
MNTRSVGRYNNMKKTELIEALEERMEDMTEQDKKFYFPLSKKSKKLLIIHLESMDAKHPITKIELLVNKIPPRYQIESYFKI